MTLVFFLTHPDYLLDEKPYQRKIICPGDKTGDNQYFVWYKGERSFTRGDITYGLVNGEGYQTVGCASGFVPELKAPEVPEKPHFPEVEIIREGKIPK